MMFPKNKAIRNAKYLSSIRKLPCEICGNPNSEAHHLIGHGHSGMGTKAGDDLAFPLCRIHHHELHSVYGYREWEKIYNCQWVFVEKTQKRLGVYNTFKSSNVL